MADLRRLYQSVLPQNEVNVTFISLSFSASPNWTPAEQYIHDRQVLHNNT